MQWKHLIWSLGCLFAIACASEKSSSGAAPSEPIINLDDLEEIGGNQKYLASPYVCAGDQAYMVGHQDGTFPDLGWHVTGEMGGVWAHPIKLMDGFLIQLTEGKNQICLNQADTFLNYPLANKHVYFLPEWGLQVERRQYVPDGKRAIVVELELLNNRPEARDIQIAFNAFVDLRPVWLGERTNMVDAADTAFWQEDHQHWVAKDLNNDWFVSWTAGEPAQDHQSSMENCQYAPVGKGCARQSSYRVQVPAQGKRSLPFVISGSDESMEKAVSEMDAVLASATELWKEKEERYQRIGQQATIEVPDEQLETAFRWVKYNTDWLITEVPGIGRGLSAGIPDYPWWFGCDNEYSLQGVVATGRFDLAKETLRLIAKFSKETNGNGRVVHEVSSNGAVFNPGNLNETPQLAKVVFEIYKWTEDRAFLEEMYPMVTQGLDWMLETHDPDGNLVADGFGMMEIHGLDTEMIDVASYTWQAFDCTAKMAAILEKPEEAKKFQNLADQLSQKINGDFWVEDFASYADFICTPDKAGHLIEDAIVRADTLNKPWAVEELEKTLKIVQGMPAKEPRGFVAHHNWVVNTPMEVGVADPDKAKIALETGSQFVNPFGMFVTGIDRDETAGKDRGSFAEDKKIFSYTGAVMTLPTGVQAIAENNYGNPDKALEYLQRMTESFGYALPGSIYEVSPDFGMMTQAWNIYAYAVPIVTQFFGIQPQGNQVIHLAPRFPTSWPEAKISQVKIGENVLSLDYQETEQEIIYTISQTNPAYEIIFYPKEPGLSWTQNGSSLEDGDGYRAKGEQIVWRAAK
ncbi:MAG: glycogen debranching protein [Bacteroidota bacterium]